MDDAELKAILRTTNLSVEEVNRVMTSFGQSVRRTNSSVDSLGRYSNTASNSIKTAYSGLVNTLNRAAKEQSQPFEVGIDVMLTGADTISKVLGNFGVEGSAFSKRVGGIGATLSNALSKVPGPLGLLAAGVDVAKDGFSLLAEQLILTYNSFKDITKNGVLLGGGLTEFAGMVDKSGVPMRAFTRGLQLARNDLAQLGMRAGDASQRVASVMGEITANGGELYQQLDALGYSTEEQMQLIAQQMANDRAAGIVRLGGDKAIAAQTVELAKNMRVLSDLTGQDAKQLQEKARVQSLETDLLKKAMQEGGPQAVEKMRKQLEVLQTIPADARKGIIEMLSTGGQATDAATNILYSSNSAYREMIQGLNRDLSDPNISPVEAQKRLMASLSRAGTEALESQGSVADEMSKSARLTGDSTAMAVKSANDAFIQFAVRLKEEAVAPAYDAGKNLAALTDPLTEATAKTAAAGLKFQKDVQATLQLPMKEMAEGISAVSKTLADGSGKLREIFTGLYNDYIKTGKESEDTKKKPEKVGREGLEPKPPTPPKVGREGMESPTPPKVGREGMESPTPPKVGREGMEPKPKTPAKVGREGMGPTPRENGGPVDPNAMYLTGEKGPELLVPKSKATILPNEMLKGLEEIKNLSSVSKIMEKAISDNSVIKKQFEVMSSQLMNPKNTDTYQPEMLSLLRQLVMTNSEVKAASSEMVAIMEDILSVQSRMANA